MSEAKHDIIIPDIIPELERGPLWLRQKRRFSREAYNDAPIPPRGLHLWRYTDPAAFVVDRTTSSDTAYHDNYDVIEKVELHNLSEGHLSGLVSDFGGREIRFHGFDRLRDQGIVVTTLSEAVERYPGLVERYLYELVNAGVGKFEAMNGALWNDGIFIHVPDGEVIEKPIHLLREAGSSDSAQFPRALVVVGQNAQLTLIDEYGGGAAGNGSGGSYSNGAVEMFGLPDSRTRYVMLQRQSSVTTSYLTHRARIDRGANMLTIALSFGGAVTKQNFGVTLNGPGAESNMYGLLFGSGNQHFDNHTIHHHASGQTRSDIDFKVVLRDRAVSAYTGLIRIDRMAKSCEAYQENRNLLLNLGTRAETIPELEILNEDVMCSHGATIGPIDPMMVFYLQARGIRHQEAVRMIVSGFVSDTLRQVPRDLQERITGFVTQRLEHI
ncbi:MAG: Fe-S cluster assembly protein SufD [Candidatus Zixiibacteriota bacterium]|nr:MAG: Fe-S cluster assembly protein SufD [candidate division Zixibacteria bacterium]